MGCMKSVALLLALCLAVGSAIPSMADDEATEKEAWQLYRGVFEEGLEPAERIETLERVATDYPDTAWADDALWVLSEVARKRGDARRAILFERQLLERDAAPSLETFTLRQNIYARSRLPHVLFVLDRTGTLYRHEEEKVIVFDPLLMVIREDLASQYEKQDIEELAVGEYRRAIAAAPPDCVFRAIYKRRADRIEKRIAWIERVRNQSQDGDDSEQGEDEPVPEGEEPEESQDDGTGDDDQEHESAGNGEDGD